MNVTAQAVLNALFNPTETVCLRVFDDRKTGVFAGAKLSCECGKYVGMEDTLHKHNEQHRGIFYVVNYGGQEDTQIVRINAQFVEMDEGSFEEQQTKIDAFPMPPSMIIRTRKSLHTYWFMDGSADVSRFRTVQKQLVKHFGGDPMCVNESRVMRLPGFYHCKKEPVMVECISFHPERKYSQEQLAEVLPEVETKPVERMNGTEKGLDIVLRSCDFMQHCRVNASTLSKHDWYAMITNLAAFDGGTKAIHELSAPYPSYNEAATQKKINHFLTSGTKPMTCLTIAEKGFKCPKLQNGQCSCKSPAALCYQPVSSEVLLQLVRELPVTGEALTDLQTAKSFISQFLYNHDVVTADVIISTELREHFNLKASFLKPLIAIYKDVSRAYQASKGAKRAKAGSQIPDWYEMTDRGLRFLPGVLAKEMSQTQLAFYAAEQHFCYSNGVYTEMSEMQAQHLVQEKMLIRETKMSQIVDAEKQWRLLMQRDIRELNANPYIINVRNGLYNVLENDLTEHTPEYLSTVQLNVSYDKTADCPRFKQFLYESMGGDMDQVRLIQEMLGYFLIPVNSA